MNAYIKKHVIHWFKYMGNGGGEGKFQKNIIS